MELSQAFRRTGSGIAIAIVGGLTGTPASAVAGPVEDVVRQATQPLAGTVEQVRAATPAVRQTVGRTAARIRPTVEAVTGPKPVRSAVAAVSEPVARAAERTAPAISPAIDAQSGGASTPAASPPVRRPVGGPAGAIDRDASRRTGGAARPSVPSAPASDVGPLALPDVGGAIAASVEQPRGAASSAAAAGDDGGFDLGQPPFGGDGGASLLGGPAGVALLALGLLAALLTLVPRFFSALLPTPPARWGSAASPAPIERPG
ncbi:MAG TPA: hypothetical protein VFQ14_01585 [Thermoleophilaceae bacterium]|nr:hypothetical protein [Thermoleophilaceae bacterium]